jgi:V/A-type H+-transporting ATPase subunit I
LLAACGSAAAVFGFLYGSLFGFEGVLQPLWIRPIENVDDILIASIAIGVVLLSLGMMHNIASAVLEQRWGYLLFRSNGLAGIVFYWSLVGLGASALAGRHPVSPVLLAVLAACSGLLVAFSEFLEHFVEKTWPLLEGGFGTYLIQGVFELFETVLGLLSNTLSYVRMGAFAVAHGTLSMVVLILADIISPARGAGYWVVVALGNLFVIAFEGLIVGIQTLRLEYYEFFSKFFSGSGVRHRPLALISREEE